VAPPEVLQQGKRIVQQGDPERRVPACASCHGKALTGVLPNVPGLLGLSRDYLVAQIGAWRTGQRRAAAPDCMAEVARRLSPEDLFAVTAWLAAEPLPAHPHPVAAALPHARPARRHGKPIAVPEPETPPLRCGFVQPPVAGSGR
jgi:cytochrome c553